MLPSRNMLFTVLFLISMPALHEGEATIMVKRNQVFSPLQPQVPPTSLPVPDSPKTGDTWFGQKALAIDFPLLRRELLKGYSHPSAPNPDTYIPASTSSSTNHKAAPSPEFPFRRRKLLKGHTQPSAPNPKTYIPASTSSSTNHKGTPAPSPEFSLLRRKLLKGYTPPSAPTPDTYIPASASTLANHKTASTRTIAKLSPAKALAS
ncbi:hypothetical protein CMV_017217 [Castanea mollissima]|uniref:Uncharacterized protein n=1 Tax=Castanea mollissima TaxID=60419 RepID=A0A8J4R2J4_9ROSI|nr:hypothetical protein CMV_017217 [Castanea mollissima]